jgi:hypothetical protein
MGSPNTGCATHWFSKWAFYSDARVFLAAGSRACGEIFTGWMEGDANLVTGYALLTLSYGKPKCNWTTTPGCAARISA